MRRDPSAATAGRVDTGTPAAAGPPVVDGNLPAAVSRWRRLLFGVDARTAMQLRFCLLSMGQHLFWALLYLHAHHSGHLGSQAMQWLVATNLLGIVCFYPCIRLGWTAGLRDSGLVLPQMLWASASAAFAFALVPTMRTALLQLLCMIQMFGFFSLRPRQLLLAGGAAALMLATVLAIGVAGGLPDFSARQELYPAALTLGVLGGLTGLTSQHAIRRGRLSARKVELNAAVAAVRDLVIRDSLTGLLNRRHMLELLQQEQARALQTGRPFAVALMDLDHFKRINDLHGHGIGDEVLRRFAELATRSVRQSDTVARWGGEEFLVLMPETCLDDEALAPLVRLRDEVRQEAAASLLPRVGLTFSAGIAFHRQGDPFARSIASADGALYTAKAEGRDRVSVAPRGTGDGGPFPAAAPVVA